MKGSSNEELRNKINKLENDLLCLLLVLLRVSPEHADWIDEHWGGFLARKDKQ